MDPSTFALGDPISGTQYASFSHALPLKPDPVELCGKFIRLVPFDESTHLLPLWRVLNGSPSLGHAAYDADALVWRYSVPASVGIPGHGAEGVAVDDITSPTPTLVINGTVAVRRHNTESGADPRLPLSVFTRHQRTRTDAVDGRMYVAMLLDGTIVGQLSLMACRPQHLVVEIGYVAITPAFQGTPVTSEATYLLLRHAFDLGFRRVEWKCDSNNARSRAAALRIGFTFEGVFRRHMVMAGLGIVPRNRDTWWASVVDEEWPRVRQKLEDWLGGPQPVELFNRRSLQLAVAQSA